MQFRASEQLEVEIAETKARILRTEGRKAKYSETPVKTMSLKGIGEQPGFGESLLEWMALNYPGATVALVEGGKDYLSGRTLGLPVCATAGTGSMLSDRAMNALQHLRVAVCFDGDESGQTVGYQRADDLRRAGVDVAGVHRSACLAATYAHDDRMVALGDHLDRHCRCFVRDGQGRPTDQVADPDGLDLTDCLALLVRAGKVDAPAAFDRDKADALAGDQSTNAA